MRKKRSERDNIAVTALAMSLSPRSVLLSGPIPSDDVFGKVSSRQMNSQQELPTRNDLQSCKIKIH